MSSGVCTNTGRFPTGRSEFWNYRKIAFVGYGYATGQSILHPLWISATLFEPWCGKSPEADVCPELDPYNSLNHLQEDGEHRDGTIDTSTISLRPLNWKGEAHKWLQVYISVNTFYTIKQNALHHLSIYLASGNPGSNVPSHSPPWNKRYGWNGTLKPTQEKPRQETVSDTRRVSCSAQIAGEYFFRIMVTMVRFRGHWTPLMFHESKGTEHIYMYSYGKCRIRHHVYPRHHRLCSSLVRQVWQK